MKSGSDTTISKEKLSYQWSEESLDWLVIFNNQVIDRVGAHYAAKHPNWRRHVENKFEAGEYETLRCG